MSIINVTEYKGLGRDYSSHILPAGEEPSLNSENITIEVSSNVGSTFNGETRFIRVVAEIDCRIAIGENPVADGNSVLLPAGNVEYFGIKTRFGHKLAVIQS